MSIIDLRKGDSFKLLADMPENSIDAIVCDPPYGLGFMGAKWDHPENIAFDREFWKLTLNVLRPGGHLVAFSGTRTYHRMACAIEDAGFEIRTQLAWVFSAGFPKSLDVSKAIDKVAGDEAKRWRGWGTGLRPSFEPICLARKPFKSTVAKNVLQHGTGALNIDACRVGNGEERRTSTGGMAHKASPVYGKFATTAVEPFTTSVGRWPANLIHDGSPEVLDCFSVTREGSAARFFPSFPPEPIQSCFYSAKATAKDRAGSSHPTVKPVALMRWLVRLVTPQDRVIFECVACNSKSLPHDVCSKCGGALASRIIKSTILDPFAGSGTTGEAARQEGFDCILMEREIEYQNDIERRFGLNDFADPADGKIL